MGGGGGQELRPLSVEFRGYFVKKVQCVPEFVAGQCTFALSRPTSTFGRFVRNKVEWVVDEVEIKTIINETDTIFVEKGVCELFFTK